MAADIRRHRDAYYVQNQPTVSDETFDRLLRELTELEAEHAEW